MQLFRFGVQCSRADNAQGWRDTARRLESWGYNTLTIPDHFDGQFGPFAAAMAALDATSTLRVGLQVLCNDYRHPATVAAEAATIELLSEGRLELGLGAGWLDADYHALGLAKDAPAQRINRLAEAIDVVQGLWRGGGEPFSYQGAHYQLSGLVSGPKPHSPHGPPLVVGGGGQKVLTLAAQRADIIGLNASLAAGVAGRAMARTALAAAFDERVAWVRAAAGERFATLELQVHTFVALVAENRTELLELAAPGFGLSVDDAAGSPLVLVGTVPQLCETLVARRERFGFSYIVIHEHEAEAFAPVVAHLSGT